jgi:hypothetical protein
MRGESEKRFWFGFGFHNKGIGALGCAIKP